MHPADKGAALKLLQAIAARAILAVARLEGNEAHAYDDDTSEVLEAVSMVELHIERLERLELWEMVS